VVIRSLEATAFDTTFTNAFSEEFRAAYDLAVGWLRAETFGQPGIDITTTTQDVYWIEGAPIDQALTFHASLQVGAITTQNCGHHCAAGYVSASIAEVGVPSSPCPGSSQPCVVVTRRGYEPFRLGVSLVAGIGGSVFSASAKGLASLRISGLPPGAYVTSCSGYISDTTVPVQLSLAYARVEEGVARLAWYTPDRSVPLATVHRRSDDEGWTRLGEILADGSGYLVYEDRAIVAGIRYGYRLGVTEGGEERLLGETWLEIPSSVRLTLDQVAPNPATGPLRARFSLPSARPARLEVFDLGGRRVHVREVGALGRGDHTLVLEETGPLRPGIYLVRLAQDDARISRRVVKIR
jgi:hypothetical protein